MRKVNYKSDFDFVMRLKDASGKEVPFPECDWDAEFWTSSKQNAYRASCIGGEYVNCFREADGSIHFVFNSQRMGKGILKWEPHFRFPNGMYPDGIQDQFRKAQLGIELVDGDGDDVADTPDVEVYMPAVYLTAYDLAVRNGYTGTYEDYVAYTNRFPQVVENAETVNALLSDFADGKALIANALTRQGVDTASDESMQSMADKVLGLQLAVEGDPQYVEHNSRVGGYDLYNVMHNHRKAELPYMYAVSFNAPTVTLSGADAYLCSDGYYTEQSGIHKMPPAQEHYVIYYFRNRSFALTATAARFINEMCVYNGAPIVNFSNVEVCRLAIYGDEPFSTDNESAFSIVGGYLAEVAIETLESGYVQIRAENAVSVRTPNLKNLRGGVLLNYLGRIRSLPLPALTTLSGGTIANTCAALAELSLPSLATVSGGSIASNCAALAELSLPSLATVSGGSIANNCGTLAELSLPALTTVSGGTIANNCGNLAELSLPSLEIIDTNNDMRMFDNCKKASVLSMPVVKSVNYLKGRYLFRPFSSVTANRLVVDMPVCEHYSGSFTDVRTDGALCELRFGTAIKDISTQCRSSETLAISIGKGGITSVASAANWDTEALKQLLADLGDNTGGETKQLRIGASEIAKLSEEDIALAVAKNYSLS